MQQIQRFVGKTKTCGEITFSYFQNWGEYKDIYYWYIYICEFEESDKNMGKCK